MTQLRCWRCCGFVVLFRFEVEYARRVIGLLVFVYVVFERNVKAVVHKIFAAEGEALEGQQAGFRCRNFYGLGIQHCRSRDGHQNG